MSSLYELVQEHKELLYMMEDPEMDPEIVETSLESVEANIEIKAEGYVKVMRQLEADVAALKNEANFYTYKAKVIENNISKLKEALVNAMILTGHDDKEGLNAGNFKLKVVKNGGKQPITITGEVPDGYKRIIVENDNERIRGFLEGLDEGDSCEWARLEPRGKHLSIK